uniref:Putative ovule protein n=1 Tax=Solanum chacoense TaxID=4108 RepID=A0A0V0HHP2_SOLCH
MCTKNDQKKLHIFLTYRQYIYCILIQVAIHWRSARLSELQRHEDLHLGRSHPRQFKGNIFC